MDRLAGLSIDLDDRWTYLRTRGDPDWACSPSVLPIAVPRMLDLLQSRGLRATFFAVGRDAECAPLRPLLRAIVGAGHEIGNHSFSHEPWLHRCDDNHVNDEIVRAEEAIIAATSVRPAGFRGPGHSVNSAMHSILAARGYLYDASPLRTFVMPLVRRFYFRGLELSPDERRQRAEVGGTLASAFGPNRARQLAIGDSRLMELPVTTFPFLRLPIHFTYLHRIEESAPGLARRYFAAAIKACGMAGTAPCLLLHATDFLGSDDGVDMDFFPGMRLSVAHKLGLLGDCLRAVTNGRRLMPLKDVALHVSDRPLVPATPSGQTIR